MQLVASFFACFLPLCHPGVCKDLRNYIKGLSMAPGQDMKGVLATFANSPKVRTPEMSTPEPMDSTEPCPEGAGETPKKGGPPSQ